MLQQAAIATQSLTEAAAFVSARVMQCVGRKRYCIWGVIKTSINTANRQQISVAQRGEVIDHPQLLYPQMRAQRYP